MENPSYSERIRLPYYASALISFTIGTMFWVAIQQSLTSTVRLVIPPIEFIAIFYGLPLLFCISFPFAKIRLKNGVVSISHSVGRYQTENIPTKEITGIRVVDYQCSIFQIIHPLTYNGTNSRRVVVPGFKGRAISIDYQKQGICIGHVEQANIVVPSINPSPLLQILEQLEPPSTHLSA